MKQKAHLITEERKLAGRKSQWVVGDGGMGQATSTQHGMAVSFAGPRSSPVRAVLASSILPHFLVVRRTIFTVAPRTSGSRVDGRKME